MDTLRCRAYARQRVHRYTREVDRLEQQVVEATQKTSAVDKENERYKITSFHVNNNIYHPAFMIWSELSRLVTDLILLYKIV